MARVAFIGLGTMGLPMARHLVEAGHDVTGFDLDPGRAELLGIEAAPTVADAAAGAEVVLASLPSPAVVEQVAADVAGAAAPGTLFVDLSTSPPALARAIAASFEELGLDALDAPVSGGPMGAEAATLTVMVGGTAEAFARAEPFLQALGRPSHVGDAGAGQIAKLCNNLVVGVTMAGLAEACAIASREGLDPVLLYELLSTSTGDSRVLRNRYPLAGAQESHPASRGFAPLFMLDLLVKDLGLGVDLGGDDVPVARAALAEYLRAQEAGHGGLDYSAIYLVRDGAGPEA